MFQSLVKGKGIQRFHTYKCWHAAQRALSGLYQWHHLATASPTQFLGLPLDKHRDPNIVADSVDPLMAMAMAHPAGHCTLPYCKKLLRKGPVKHDKELQVTSLWHSLGAMIEAVASWAKYNFEEFILFSVSSRMIYL